MLPPQPHTSLPTPHIFTFHGFSLPFCTLHLLIGPALPSKFTYCTQSVSSCTVPLPTLPARYGCAPIFSHIFKKSCVPKLLSSVTPPHQRFTIAGLLAFGPTPSFQ